jgi:hypothetical protein
MCGSFAPSDLGGDGVSLFRLPGSSRTTEATNAAFDIPVNSSEGFFLNARGALARGRITFVTAEQGVTGGKHGATVRVEVSAKYDDVRLINLATVCTMERKGVHGTVERGLGVYTPDMNLPAASSHLRFDIRVTLPRQDSIASLSVHANTMEIVGSLPALNYPRVSIATQDARIGLVEVRATDVRMTTTNGAIDGHFSVERELVLCTSNGAIAVTVSILDVQNVTSVSATTSNGAINLDYVEQPERHHLRSHVATSNGATFVQMASDYEGDFSVHCRQSSPHSIALTCP